MQGLIEKIDPETLPKSTGIYREIQLSTLELAKDVLSDIEKLKTVQ